MNSDVFFDKEANEQNFKEFASSYDILHLAMHTIIDDINPMYSKLAFTELPNDTIEDGLGYHIYWYHGTAAPC